MTSDWRELKVEDVAAVIGGGTPSTKKEEYYGEEISWITPKDLSNFKYKRISKGNRSLTQQGLKNSSAKLLPKNTVLLTSRAPIGYVAIADREISTNQGFKNLVLKEGHDPDFFYYLLKSNIPLLEANSSGSTFKEISGSALKNIKFLIPSGKTQRNIVGILNPLDQKLELNQHMNKTLEEMAQAIFKCWFVDFEPTRAKIAGESQENICNRLKITPEILAMFPDKLVDSELGLIPEGWEVLPSVDLFNINIGKTPPRKDPRWFTKTSNGIKWVSIRDMAGIGAYIWNTSEELTPKAIEKFNVKRVVAGSVLVSFKLTVGRVAICTDNMVTNEAIAHFNLREKSQFGTYYVYNYLKQFNFDSLGSTSSIATAVNSKIIKKIPFIVPSRVLSLQFEKKVSSIFESCSNLDRQISALAQIRDTLLPKLLSGEISVGTAEETSETYE